MRAYLVVSISLLFLVGCTHISDNTVDARALASNPMPIPEFVVATKPDSNGTLGISESICFGINEGSIWIPNYDLESISNHLALNTTLTIDNHTFDSDELLIASPFVVIDRFDDEGNYIGSHGDTMSVCLESPELSTGLHVATIRTTSTQNQEYTYSWAFEIVENG